MDLITDEDAHGKIQSVGKNKLMLYKEHNLCEHFVIYSQGGIKVVTP